MRVVGLLFGLSFLLSWASSANSLEDWPLTSADSAALDSQALYALDADFKTGVIPLVDRLLVTRCGKIAFDRRYEHDYGSVFGKEAAQVGPLNPYMTGSYNYFDPNWHPYWHGGMTHSLQSVTKSVASATIGAAILHGDFKASLDTPVLHWFKTANVKNVDARKRRMTLRHLLTMTAGFNWNEDLPYADPNNAAAVMEGSRDWVSFVINRPMAFEPGTHYTYSSGVSELLAHVFRQETGQDMEDYARTHLFEPLGIHDYHWKRSPLGEVDSEGGLFLSAESLAKIGELYRLKGLWQGQRLLSAEWVMDSVSSHSNPGHGYRYGYQWWLLPYGDKQQMAWAGLGFGGQHVFVLPEEGVVAVTLGWNLLDPKYYEDVILKKLVSAVKPYRCPSPSE